MVVQQMRFTSVLDYIRILVTLIGLSYTAVVAQCFALDDANTTSTISTITAIEVRGNVRIPAETIISYTDITLGSYDKNKIDDGIKNIYATGFFSNVQTEYQNGKLVIVVEESPVVNLVAFEGNRRVHDPELNNIISVKSRSTYSLVLLKKDTEAIVNLYNRKGWFVASVNPKIIELPNNRVNVVYVIQEGKKAMIRKIAFVGNNAFGEKDLKQLLLSKESMWFRLFSSADSYDAERLAIDQEMLKQNYLNAGYADFRVINVISELSPRKDGFFVTFVLEEGQKYKIRGIRIDNKLKNVGDESLKNLLLMKAGDVFNQSKIDDTADKFTKFLGQEGYAFIDVDHSFEKDSEKQLLDITFKIGEGNKVYLNKINIKGNVRTLDKVIRREMRVEEGDSYNFAKILRSKQRLGNTGYFSALAIAPKNTNVLDKIDLDVDVTEQSTGAINFQIGYNSSSGLMGGVSLTESNLLGTGRIFEFGYGQDKLSKNVSVGFTEPHFLNRNLLAGIDLFYGSYDEKISQHEVDGRNQWLAKKQKKEMGEEAPASSSTAQSEVTKYNRYSSRNIGGSVKIGYGLTEYLNHSLRYSLRSSKIEHVAPDLSILIQESPKKRTISSVGHTLSYDRRDSAISPTKGYVLQLTQEVAGLGGSQKYLKTDLFSACYIPIYKKDVVLNINGQYGNIFGFGGTQVAVLDNFFVGQDLIRGFDIHGIGPRDKKTLDALGGKNYYAATVELNFPIGFPKELKVKGAAFVDFANVYGLDLPKLDKIQASMFHDESYVRASCGAGIIWESPLGTIRIDYGIPMRKRGYDVSERVRFIFGTAF
ncbi:Outer membrane protein assembly factor BamA [Alphaproteobacteria bacterium]